MRRVYFLDRIALGIIEIGWDDLGWPVGEWKSFTSLSKSLDFWWLVEEWKSILWLT